MFPKGILLYIFSTVHYDHYICICLGIVMSNKYCVVFLLCFPSSCVPYAASFHGIPFFDCHFGFLE